MTMYNKFWVAVVMALVAYIRARFNIDLGIDDATATGIVGAISAVLVYVVPNKPSKVK